MIKGYVQLRRGLLEHLKTMSPQEVTVYIGILLLANYKTASVNITVAELADIVDICYKATLKAIRRLEKLSYVKFTVAHNQWEVSKIEILRYYNGNSASVKNAEPLTEALTEPLTEALTEANVVSDRANKDLQNPNNVKEVIRSIKKPQTDFLTSLKTNIAYQHINLDIELAKMDAWLLAHKGRQKTKRFVVNWLNKTEKPLEINGGFRKP